MEIIRQKSTCCTAAIRRFGGKRRQCKTCKRTWRVHPAKRGPKTKRVTRIALERYRTNCVGSLAAAAASEQIAASTLQKRLVRARNKALQDQQPPACLSVPHILLADALAQVLHGHEYTTYLLLARPVDSTQATVCYVHTVPGHESGVGWQAAVAALPATMRSQTKALVCDGHAGLTSLAARHGWVLQRCRFHCLQNLNKYLRLWHQAKPEVYRIHELVHCVLESANDEKVTRALGLLGACAKQTPSREVSSILRGLIRHHRDYRSYIYYPDLHLPATNNACECSFRRVRALQDKARGWRTPTAHAAWVRYALTGAPPICCRGGETKW